MPENGTTPLAPTPASAWKSERTEGFLVTLPSGNVARVRRTMDMLTLLKTGRIPNPLAVHLKKMIEGKGVKQEEVRDTEIIQQMIDLAGETVPKMMIEPRCEVPPEDDDGTWTPSEGAISLYDLTIEDRIYLMSVGQGAAADLASFRAATAAAMDPAPDVGEVQPKAKRASRAKQ